MNILFIQEEKGFSLGKKALQTNVNATQSGFMESSLLTDCLWKMPVCRADLKVDVGSVFSGCRSLQQSPSAQ